MAERQYRTLTKRTVDRLSVNGKDAIFWDRDLPGFGVRVYRSGKKVFVVQTRAFGRSKRVSLGQHGDPHFSVDHARKKATDIIARIKIGQPSVPPQPAPDPTVADLAEHYEREYVAMHCKPLTISHYRLMLRKHIVPALGERLVADVEYKDILAFHNSLHHMPTVANRAADMLVKMFNLADAWGWRPSGTNPCRGVARFRVEKHERFLTREELFRLGEALRAAPAERLASTHAAAAIRLLVLTGCRRNEILGLRWDDLNFDTGEMRLRDSKTGTRMVPLTPAVARVFDGLCRTPGNPWVFPGKKKGTRLVNLNDSWDRVRKRAGLDDVRLHDLRHYYRICLIPGLTPEAGGERARWALVSGIITGCSGMPARRRQAGIVPVACVKAWSGPSPALSISGRRADRCTWSRRIHGRATMRSPHGRRRCEEAPWRTSVSYSDFGIIATASPHGLSLSGRACR